MRHSPRQTTAQVGSRTCTQEMPGSSPRLEILSRCSLVITLYFENTDGDIFWRPGRVTTMENPTRSYKFKKNHIYLISFYLAP